MSQENEENVEASGEKLQKALANAGFGSRREMEKYIKAGEVSVNGSPAELGARVAPGDKIKWRDNSLVVPEPWKKASRVILYNKPEGEICSRQDPEGRRTVFDALPPLKGGRWVSVGRLDINTSGLILFTDDGELANRLMHPSYEVDREYLVRIQGEVSDETIAALLKGVELEDGPANFTDIQKSRGDSGGSNAWFHCALMEGRNREVRRLWESQDLRVSRLKRVRFGPVFIPSFVRTGQWIELSDKEKVELYKVVELQAPRRKKFNVAETEARQRHVKRLRSSGRKGSHAPKSKPRKR